MNIEITSLKVVKEVFALHVFKDDKVVVRVLKKINKLDDVWMLAHLQNLNFSSLLKDLNCLHVFLFYLFYCYYSPSLRMSAKFDFPELSLSKTLTERVEIIKIRIPHTCLQLGAPLDLFLFRPEVQHP